MIDIKAVRKQSEATRRPLVSVVMPVYNGATYLAESIESCVAQTYPRWELVIVDDCSTDETPRIIEHYVQFDSRIRAIRNESNRKLPASMNVGYRLALGDYYSWLSSDDCFHSEAMERAVSLLEMSPQIDLVYSDFSTIDQTGAVIDKIVVPDPEVLAVRNKVGPCRFYRRALHEKLGGYDESLFLVEDYDFLLRAFCQFQLRPIHHNLYLFRLHESALTSTHASQVPHALVAAKRKNLPLLTQKNLRLAAQCHISLIDPALLRRETEQARRHALAALRCAPAYTLLHSPRVLVSAVLGPRGPITGTRKTSVSCHSLDKQYD